MSCCFDVTPFGTKGVAPQARGDDESCRARRSNKLWNQSRDAIPPPLRGDPLPLEGGDFAIDGFVGWVERSEAQRVRAITLGFSRTASGISPTYTGPAR